MSSGKVQIYRMWHFCLADYFNLSGLQLNNAWLCSVIFGLFTCSSKTDWNPCISLELILLHSILWLFWQKCQNFWKQTPYYMTNQHNYQWPQWFPCVFVKQSGVASLLWNSCCHLHAGTPVLINKMWVSYISKGQLRAEPVTLWENVELKNYEN